MPGEVILKLTAGGATVKTQSKNLLTSDQMLNQVLVATGVDGLQPLFPSASQPAANAMIATPDGGSMPMPDLTRWYKANLSQSTDVLSAVAALSQTAGVDWAEPDFLRKPEGGATEKLAQTAKSAPQVPSSLPGSGSDPLFDQQWYLAATHVPEAWAYLESQGLPPGGSRDIVVAVIDTGVDYNHPDLAANIWVNPAELNGLPGVDDDGNGYVDDIHGANIVANNGDPMDDNGHGTHVAGIIAAQGNNGIGGVGVAYNVQIMPIKAAQYSGVLAASDIARGVYYAVQNGADVINMSFGGYARSQVEEDALSVAFGQAVLVAAAGNDGLPNDSCNGLPPSPMYPADYNWVLGVMAGQQSPKTNGDYLAGFSNYDCVPQDINEYELMAPGENIWSTLPAGHYAAWSGTSMAAPIVSGIAALVRTAFPNKDTYSSRFIMGQIATTGPNIQAYTPNGKPLVFYHGPDALVALTTTPQPSLSYLQHWVFDTSSQSPNNDNDGIVDAGETIDLAIVIRNHWGKADPVIVKLEPWANGAVSPDPYVTMLADTVDYGAIGSFNWDDNGLIYDGQGMVTGVQHPFSFQVASNTPNDHQIPMRLTITAGNGFNPSDPNSPFSFIEYFYLMVQNGVTLPSVIDHDMTLTSDHLWLVENGLLVSQGATLTVEAGTQIQFWSAVAADPYSLSKHAFFQVEGKLLVQGSAENPVEMFTGLLFQAYPIVIQESHTAYVALVYAKIANPSLGHQQNHANGTGYPYSGPIDVIDHCYFSQEVEDNVFFYDPVNKAYRQYSTTVEIEVNTLQNSIFHQLGNTFDKPSPIYVYGRSTRNIFDQQYMNYYAAISTDNTFLKNVKKGKNSLASIRAYTSPNFLYPSNPLYFNSHTYVKLSDRTPFGQAEAFAQKLGGYMVSINDAAENEFISINFGRVMIGLSNASQKGVYSWASSEPISFTSWSADEPVDKEISNYVVSINGNWYSYLYDENTENGLTGSYSGGPPLIEFPSIITQEDLDTALETFIPVSDSIDNAFLNSWWDPNPDHWLSVIDGFIQAGNSYVYSDRSFTGSTQGSYWGTTSDTLISASINDYNDDFNLGKVLYQPILTTPPETAYPFVADVHLSTAGEPNATVVGAEPVTFTVTFNRDMDTTIQPQVSFGPDVPMTDYTIHPVNGGWQDPRAWVGTFDINPITGDGYQLIRVAGAVAADDPWLVTGDDAGRFRFEIITSGTESMNLQATGGEGYVDLGWTQSDFELLAGFNLYRATSQNGVYNRLNTTIIPPDVRSWRDSSVTPGQPYYYKFTVVKSDMSESDFSNIAQGTPLDTIPPVLTHKVVTSAEPGLALTLTADVTDNVAVTGVTLFYRHAGTLPYSSKVMLKTTGSTYSATLEGSLLTSPGIDYYIEATDGISITRSGQAESPHPVIVIDQPVLTILTPNTGLSSGGTTVTISGSNFKPGATVNFGAAAASAVTVVSSNQITCLTPAHFPALVDVTVTNTDSLNGTLLNAFTFNSSLASLILPNSGGGTGKTVTIPVNAGNVNGLVSARLTVTFDPAVLRATGAHTGTLTPGWVLAANTNTSGQVTVLLISSGGAVAGTGTVVSIDFDVIGEPDSSSALTISSVSLNDGAIPVETSPGTFTVENVYDVSGTIAFWKNDGGVPNVDLTLKGTRDYTATSNSGGTFTVQNAAIDDYVLTPTKQGGDNGAITAYDASLALQIGVGLYSPSPQEFMAADVNNTGTVTGMDAYYILQQAVGLISLPFPGSGLAWKFLPASRSYTHLSADASGQDFNAVLLGDVSGNYAAGVVALAGVQNEAVLEVTSSSPANDGTVNATVKLDPVQNGVYGLEFTLVYDPSKVTLENVTSSLDSANAMMATNNTSPGIMRIAIASAVPFENASELLRLQFHLASSNTQTALQLIQASLNEGRIPVKLVSGMLGWPNNFYMPLIIKK